MPAGAGAQSPTATSLKDDPDIAWVKPMSGCGGGCDGEILVAMYILRRQNSLVDGLPLPQHCGLHLG